MVSFGMLWRFLPNVRLSQTVEIIIDTRKEKKYKKGHLSAAERKKVQKGSFWVWRSNSMQVSGRGPSLGLLGPNSMGNPNLISVRSGRPGLVRYPIFSLLGGNSRFRCTTLNLIADLEPTQFSGSYRVSLGQN